MDKNELLDRLSRVAEVGEDEWMDDCFVCEQYPYSVPLRLLSLAARKVWGPDGINSHTLRHESLYVSNTSVLQGIVEKAKAYEPADTTFDIMKEINSYQDVSFKTAPKSVILSKFLRNGSYPAGEHPENESLDVLGKKSIASDASLVSETLALLLEKQGKFDKAVEMYEKLSVLYPEKSATFANHITELRGY